MVKKMEHKTLEGYRLKGYMGHGVRQYFKDFSIRLGAHVFFDKRESYESSTEIP